MLASEICNHFIRCIWFPVQADLLLLCLVAEMFVILSPVYGEKLNITCAAGAAATALQAQQQHSEAGGRAIPGSRPAMTSPFSAWSGGSDGESQVNEARMKALGRRKKSHKKIALEVVKEADKEGEEGGSLLHNINSLCCTR